jgi:WD40 repeat protein
MSSPFRLLHTLHKQSNYPLQIQYNIKENQIAIPLAQGNIDIINLATMTTINSISTNEPVISHAQYDTINPQLLWVSNKSGSIQLFDNRNNSIAMQLKAGAPVIDFDINSSNTILACGTELVGEEAAILFWDIRNSNPLSKFSESHSDDITQVKFHPTVSNAMISGSTDGLICLFDVQGIATPRQNTEQNETAEDDALYQVIKENSISKLGFFGPGAEFLYSTTHMETFSLYKFENADGLSRFGDVRKKSDFVSIDYCIDCSYDMNTQHLYLVAGSQE